MTTSFRAILWRIFIIIQPLHFIIIKHLYPLFQSKRTHARVMFNKHSEFYPKMSYNRITWTWSRKKTCINFFLDCSVFFFSRHLIFGTLNRWKRRIVLECAKDWIDYETRPARVLSQWCIFNAFQMKLLQTFNKHANLPAGKV